VTAQDAFLGLSDKQPSSAACEELAVSVKLPGVATAAGARGRLFRSWCLVLLAGIAHLMLTFKHINPRPSPPTELDLDLKPTRMRLTSAK
jgi:hypothetical protein